MQESQYREQQLELTSSNLQRRLEQITEEKEESEKEAVSWFNALEVRSASFTLTQGFLSLFLEYLWSKLKQKPSVFQIKAVPCLDIRAV